MSAPLDITTPSDREIAMSRAFDATPDQVFKAITTPALVKRWLLGPPGWEMIECDIDLRVGGKYRYLWRNTEMTTMGMGGEYLDIIPDQRIVATERFDEAWYAGSATATTTLAADGPRTKLTITMRYDSKEIRDEVLETPMDEGVAISFDHLASLLTSGAASQDAFVISRSFDAPPNLVWKAWTDESLLARWFGPPDTTIPRCTLDFREGGTCLYCMRSESDPADEHWGLWRFTEISPPKRLVFVASFATPAGEPARAPFDPNWPMEVRSTVTFAPEGAGTRVTVQWEPINPADPEREAFEKGRESMEGGWIGTLDRLKGFLAASAEAAQH